MIPVPSYDAEFAVHDGAGRKSWRPCTVVGVCGEPSSMKFGVIIAGPIQYVDSIGEVRRPLPTGGVL